jgi:5-methylcytosine-specific restriction endonuclease McrA
MEPTKICSQCGEDKPLSTYSRHKRGKYGLRAACKPCEVTYAQTRYVPKPRKVCRVIDGKKECTRCHEVKPVDEFSPTTNTTIGVNARCKACAAELTEEWRHRPGNMERHKTNIDRYYRENKDRKYRYTKAYRETNPELVAEWGRRREVRRKQSPTMQAYHRQKTQEWEKAHPENVRQRAVRRYGRKKGIPQIDVVDVDVLYARDGGICSLCLDFCPREEATQDHIIPITKPGSEESYGNSALAHNDCNRRKNNKIVVAQMLAYYKGDPSNMARYVPAELLPSATGLRPETRPLPREQLSLF